MKLSGKVWKLGDNVSLADLLPLKYDDLGVNDKWAECATHVLEEVDPSFASAVRPGDIIVAGAKLGVGHAHFYRATFLACKATGIAALLAETTVDLFQRGAIDQGLPTWAYPGLNAFVNAGEQLELDLATGEARNLTRRTAASFAPLSPIVLDILAADGAFNWAKKRAAENRSAR